MASGSFGTSKSNNLNLYVEWSSTSDVNTNSSKVTVNLYVKSYSLRGSALSGSYLSVNGNQSDWSYTFNILNNSSIATTKAATKTVTVTHNSDGTKSIPIKANFKFNGTYGGVYIGDLSVSKTVTLDNIPRASSLSVPPSVNVWSDLNVVITPSSGSYRHKVRFTVDGDVKYTSGYIAAGTRSFSYSIPRSWVTGTSDKKLTVTLYTYTSNGTSSIGSKSTTTTIKVPCSSFTMPSSTNTGSAFKITISPYNSSCKHLFKFIVNGSTKLTTDLIDVGTNSYSYTIPHTWLTTASTTTMTIYCYTYNSEYDDDYTARVTKTITLNVPSTIVPSITSVTSTIVDGLSGKYVQGKSKVKLSIDAETSGGSPISSYIYKGANINGTASSYTGTSSSKTSGIINATGTQTYTVQVKDKRDRYSAEKKTSIVVYEYSAPKIVSITAQRCKSNGTLDVNGTYAKVTVKISYSDVGGANKRTVTLSNSLDDFATDTVILSQDTADITYTGVYGGNFELNSTYTIKAVIQDAYNTGDTISKTAVLKVAERTINIAKHGNGVSVGGISSITSATSSGLFECNWGTTFKEGVNIDNSTLEYLTITRRNMSMDINQDETNELVDIRTQLYVGDTGSVTCCRRYKTNDVTDFVTQGYWQLGDSRMYISYPLYVNGAITTNTQFGSTSTYSNGNFNIYCQWKDGGTHDLIVRDKDGLTTAIGWVGNSSNVTTLDIRPKIASARGELFTNAKTDAYDAKQGICISNNGRIYLVGTVNGASGAISPYSSGIVFAYNRSTSGTASILETASGVLTVKGTLKATVDSSSDERIKKDFNTLEKFEGFYNDLSPCCFRTKSDDERYHIGFVAQQVEQSLNSNGLTKDDFGALNITPYEGDVDESSKDCAGRYKNTGIKQGEDSYGLTYSEFIALNTYMIQKLQNTVKEQQKEIEALKAEINNIKTNN